METAQNELDAARQRVAQLDREWAEMTARIEAGEATPEDYEGRPGLLSRIQGAREAVAAAETRAQRLSHHERTAEVMERVEQVRLDLGRLVPELLMALTDMDLLVQDIYRVGTQSGGSVDDLLGVPVSFAADLSRAITVAAPNTEWDYSGIGHNAKRPEGPKLREPATYMLRERAFAPRLPPGSSGTIDLVSGEVHIVGGT
jgi:DNA segregation ATPase FtsK/SpoIIIE-like protein